MDSFNITTLKIEKANAILRYRRLQKITTVFRFIELFVVLIILSRFTTLFPVTFKLSGEYFRGLSLALFSPLFVFVVGNVIVIILFLKSGKFSTQSGNKNSSDLCDDEYIGNRENNQRIESGESEKQRKQSMCVRENQNIVVNVNVNMNSSYRKMKIYRSNSENLRRDYGEKDHRELRRSVTERCWKSESDDEKQDKDDMSGEEFRRTVEAFIARQQRILREEEEF